MKKFIVSSIVFSFLFFSGCTKISEMGKPDVCKNGAYSIIYTYIPNPTVADAILQISYKEILNKFSGENREQFIKVAIVVLENLKILVETEISYKKFFDNLNEYTDYLNKYCGNTIIIVVSSLLGSFKTNNTFISSCDSYLLKIHITNILTILKNI